MPLRNVLAVILGGGRGSRLLPLTRLRAKPAVPIGGKYRLIDVPISNCLNSGAQKIYVLTQFLSASLHRHIYQTYKFDLFSGGYVYTLAAEETRRGMDWYQGTADAVRKQLPHLVTARVDDVLILSGDHLYRMDYTGFVELHREKRADVTIAVQPVSSTNASRYGILKTDADGRVSAFLEKPSPDEAKEMECVPGADRPCLASMGIYVFRPDVLREILLESDAEDFGKQIIPAAIEGRRVYAFTFDGYWVDLGTIRSFYDANLALTLPDPPFDFHHPRYPIYTRPRFLPSSRVDGCRMQQTVLTEGCFLQECSIRESVIGLRSIIEPGARVKRTVMMGADFYETPERKLENQRLGQPDVGVGRGSTIEEAIIDKNARIGREVTIRAHDPGEEAEEENFTIRDGVVVIPKNAIIPDGTDI
jgi:glucose-1-phosphate adenylyltransferase